MWRRIVIWTLIAAILLAASCIGGGMAPGIPPPGITGDNSGGAIVTYAVYESLTEQSLYVQRISPEGDFVWGGNGVLIGSTGNGVPYSEAVSDGSGGAIVAWSECLPEVPGEPPSCQTYVARVDSEGNVEWRKHIAGIDQAIPDGSGGVIIAYDDPFGNLSVLKIDSEGNLPWGEDAVSLGGTAGSSSRDIASDGSGGVIAILKIHEDGGEYVSYAQRIDSSGSILWGSRGAQVIVGWAEGLGVVDDGSGGAVVVFQRNTPDGIYVQRMDAGGSILWEPDGVPVCLGPPHPHDAQIVADITGGVIVFFVDERGVCAQRVNADGHRLWDGDVELPATSYYSLVSDGSGGVICVWYGGGAQRLDGSGTKLWGPDGITLTFRDLYLPVAVSGGCGGALISWSADVRFRNSEVSDVSYYVQRVDADGDVVWGDGGMLLNP
jgi:hypothetical protein